MLSTLPSLAPRDSYALWYTSSDHSNDSAHSEAHAADHSSNHGHSSSSSAPQSHRRPQHGPIGRSPLAQLRADEVYMERRKLNVQNYGVGWIRPPGINKTIHMIREEEREAKEHEEAMRREALQQELAEAEMGEVEELAQESAELEAAPDPDDEIPDADDTAIEPESEDDPSSEEDDTPVNTSLRIPDDRYRDALLREEGSGGVGFGDEGNDGSETEDASQMFLEEDVVQHVQHDETLGMDADLDMGMEGNLDDDVPEAGGYEHTDTEAELSSSDEETSSAGSSG